MAVRGSRDRNRLDGSDIDIRVTPKLRQSCGRIAPASVPCHFRVQVVLLPSDPIECLHVCVERSWHQLSDVIELNLMSSVNELIAV